MSVSESLSHRINTELLRMEEDCIHSAKSHFNACDRWSLCNYLLGIPSVVLSAGASAAFFEDYPEIAGAMSAVVSVLAALMTFLKPSERATGHKNSGNQYLSLRNDARVFREIELLHSADDSAAMSGMNALTTRRNELNQASPQFSNRDFRKAKKGVEAGEATHAVDMR